MLSFWFHGAGANTEVYEMAVRGADIPTVLFRTLLVLALYFAVLGA